MTHETRVIRAGERLWTTALHRDGACSEVCVEVGADDVMAVSVYPAGKHMARVDHEALGPLLVDAIEQWMQVDTSEMSYAHGNAQGIARAMAALEGTSFTAAWEAGLDRYQARVTGTG